MSLKKFKKVFPNDFLTINKINLTNLFEEITSGSYSGMESSLRGSKNHGSDAFPRQQNTEPSLVFHWAWSREYNLLLNTFQEMPLQLIPYKPIACMYHVLLIQQLITTKIYLLI